MDISNVVLIFKALSDKNRLQIVELLSGKELCACKILEKFEITQPTLSHHMKILSDCGIINTRKNGKWSYYSLNVETLEKFKHYINEFNANKDDEFICK